jgi:ATP-dependent DNA ligase
MGPCLGSKTRPPGDTAQAIIDAEVLWLDSYGMSNFEALHNSANDARASACAFDLLMRDGEDLRKKPYSERKAMLLKALRRSRAGRQSTPNVVEQEKGTLRGIIQDERGQDQPASKEDARLGAPKPRERYHRIIQAIWWV